MLAALSAILARLYFLEQLLRLLTLDRGILLHQVRLPCKAVRMLMQGERRLLLERARQRWSAHGRPACCNTRYEDVISVIVRLLLLCAFRLERKLTL